MREPTITFFTKAHFWFFFKIMLESWGCGLYASAAYTRVFTVIEAPDRFERDFCFSFFSLQAYFIFSASLA